MHRKTYIAVFILCLCCALAGAQSVVKTISGDKFLPNQNFTPVFNATNPVPDLVQTVSTQDIAFVCSSTPFIKQATGYASLDILTTETAELMDFSFDVAVTLDISFTKKDNSTGTASKELRVNFNPAAGTKFTEESICELPDVVSVQVTVTGYIFNSPLTQAQQDKVAKLMQVKLTLDVEQYCTLLVNGCNANPTATITPGFAHVKWNKIEGAAEYDLEWTYVDSYTGSSVVYNFRNNASRVTISTTNYDIPLVYNKGWLLFRVRGIGRNPQDLDRRVYGVWNPCTGSDKGIVSGYPPNSKIPITPHEDDEMNWQITSTYAQEGRHKDVVRYADGAEKVRQEVSSLNTEGKTIVGETIYDYNWNPAIQVLPAPVDGQELKFHANFNQNSDIPPKPYNYRDFENPNACGPQAESLNTTSGASIYYSKQNPDAQDEEHAYIPDAEGYPIIHTEFTKDRTGRPLRQGAPGKAFQLGNGHETTYKYETPFQGELDALLGLNAGHALHYLKQIVEDPNGQLVINYLNPAGKTVASMMAGNPPDGLLALDSYKAVTQKEPLPQDDDDKDYAAGVILMQKTHTPTVTGKYYFSYQMTGEQYRDLTCMAQGVCYDCIYDLEFTVVDECGVVKHQKIEEKIGGDPAQVDYTCAATKPALSFTFDVLLYAGVTYTFTKRLTVNAAAADAYVQHFLNDPSNQCSNVLPSWRDTAEMNVDTSGCNMECGEVESVNLDLDHLPQIVQDVVNKQINEVAQESEEVLCDTLPGTTCELARMAMLADVSPYGQYGKLPPAIESPEDAKLSMFMPGNVFGVNWKSVIQQADGSNIHTFQELIDGWQDHPKWADAFLEFHPEKCYFDYCDGYLGPSEEFDAQLRAADWKTAAQKDWMKPVNSNNSHVSILLQDPFYGKGLGNAPGASYYSVTNAKTGNYQLTGLNIIELALRMVHCPPNATTCNPPVTWAWENNTQPNEAIAQEEWEAFRGLYLALKEYDLYDARTTYAIDNGCYNGCIGQSPFKKELHDFYVLGCGSSIFNTQVLDCPFLHTDQPCNKNEYWLYAKRQKRFPSLHDLVLPEGYDPYLDKPQDFVDAVQQGASPWAELEGLCGYCHMPMQMESFLWYLYNRPQTGDLTLDEKKELDNFGVNLSNVPASAGYNYKLTTATRPGKFMVQMGSCVLIFDIPDPEKTAASFCCFAATSNTKFTITVIYEDGSQEVLPGKTEGDCTPFLCEKEISPCLPNPGLLDVAQLFNQLNAKGKLVATNPVAVDALGSHLASYFKTDEYEHVTDGFQWHGQVVGSVLMGKLIYEGKYCQILVFPATPGFDYGTVATFDAIEPTPSNNQPNYKYQLTVTLTDGSTATLLGVSSCLPSAQCCPLPPGSTGSGTISCSDCPGISIQGGLFGDPNSDYKLGPVDCDQAFCEGGPIREVEIKDRCAEELINQAKSLAQLQFDEYLKDLARNMRDAYVRKCMDALEKMSVEFQDARYHAVITLYDLAGNQVQTVAPQGVKPMSPADLAYLNALRNAPPNQVPTPLPGSYAYPRHSFVSCYQYTTHNSVRGQQIPDHDGPSLFFFDEIGRLQASQNPEQAAGNRFSYLTYDAQSRITASLEVHTDLEPLWQVNKKPTQYRTWFTSLTTWRDITWTWYDTPMYPSVPPKFRKGAQTNLRSRIATVAVFKDIKSLLTGSYSHATHYRYSERGSVEELLQDYPEFAVKLLEYAYDPVSLTVDTLIYQRGEPDQYLQYYLYDADLRLSEVFTGPNRYLLEPDSRSFYFEYGPFRREERGKDQVIGNDFAYTIDGKIKAMNSVTLTKPEYDMGKDGFSGSPHKNYARDVVGFVEGYFHDATKGFQDYQSISGAAVEPGYLNSQLHANAPNLYNSNIRYEIQAIRPFLDPNGDPTGYAYRYDQLGRLKESWAHIGLADSNNPPGKEKDLWQSGGIKMDDYHTKYTYDANGNILTLKRHGTTANNSPLAMDDLSYSYLGPPFPVGATHNRNRLLHVYDKVAAGNYPDDIDNQPDFIQHPNGLKELGVPNYKYDRNGNLIEDRAEGLKIFWSPRGKVDYIEKTKGTIDFDYDAHGNRVKKSFDGKTDYYVLDASGNTIATYTKTATGSPNTFPNYTLRWDAAYLFGSLRLGSYEVDRCLVGCPQPPSGSQPNPDLPTYTRTRGQRLYELTSIRSDVLAVVSCRKLQVNTDGVDDFNLAAGDYYDPDVVTATEVYPFGSPKPGRVLAGGGYRFGFQGQEKDDEVKGEGNSINFSYRMHDARLGRFFSIDPLSPKYPNYSPYLFSGNKVVGFMELEGLEEMKFERWIAERNAPKLGMTTDEYLKKSSPNSAQTGLLVEVGAGFIPFVGQAIDAKDTYDAYTKGDSWDKVFATIAWIPGGDLLKGAKKIARATNKLNDLLNVVKSAGRVAKWTPRDTDKIAIIGGGMDDVIKIADEAKIERFEPEQKWIDEWENLKVEYKAKGEYVPDEFVKQTSLYKENQKWANRIKEEGYSVLDIGYKKEGDYSSYYEMEKNTIYD